TARCRSRGASASRGTRARTGGTPPRRGGCRRRRRAGRACPARGRAAGRPALPSPGRRAPRRRAFPRTRPAPAPRRCRGGRWRCRPARRPRAAAPTPVRRRPAPAARSVRAGGPASRASRDDIRVFYLDAFQIAREEAGSADLQLRMQGIAFQGAFFAASPVMANAGLTEERLFKAIEAQLQSKFGGKGAAVVHNNLKVVKRGFREMHEITDKPAGVARKALAKKDAGLPIMLRQLPEADGKVGDIHRFWE